MIRYVYLDMNSVFYSRFFFFNLFFLTEDVSDAAFVAVAGKYGVVKATNQKENVII